jgi:hypothetical protein
MTTLYALFLKFGIAMLILIFSLLSGYLSFFLWVLGVGVEADFHKVMGYLFATINILCICGGLWFFFKGQHLVAIVFAISPAPLSMASLALAIFLVRNQH